MSPSRGGVRIRRFSSVVPLLALSALLLAAQPAVAQQPLSFFKNYFVTGDYVVSGVSMFGNMQQGVGKANISIKNFPEDTVDVVAAFLYLQTAEHLDNQTSGIDHATFRGFDLGPGNSSSAKLLNPSYETRACWLKPNDPHRMVTYRADVLRYFAIKANGKHSINGSHEVSAPDAGFPFDHTKGGNRPHPIGASLLIVYRDRTQPLRGIVIYDGAYTRQSPQTMTLSIEGYYDSADGVTAPKSAKMTHIVGIGTPPLSERVFLDGTLIGQNPFKSNDGHLWDNWTVPVSLPANDDSAVLQVGPDGLKSDCSTYSAVVLSTTVQDTDKDGLLDRWETTSGLTDPNGQTLPNLAAMGADKNVKNIFIEIGYMETGPTTYGGVAKPAHSHRPTEKALKMMGDSFAAKGIQVHFDVGNAYPGAPYTIDPALARGGEAVSEQVTVACSPDPNDPSVCQYFQYPGTVGWKSGYRILRDQVLNGPPPLPNGDDPCDAPGNTCTRRFDHNRKDMFHYALFAHFIGMPKDPCFEKNPDGSFKTNENGSFIVDVTCNTPEFHIPRTNSGIGDFPGGDYLVTLGAFDNSEGLPIGTDYMQAATLMHEFGHNGELTHAGPPQIPREPNCKPNYLSVMNYLFQLRGLLDVNGAPQLDYSGEILGGVDEAFLFDRLPLGALPYRTGWYAPLETSYLKDVALAATKHCDGSDLLRDPVTGELLEPAMVRLDAINLAGAEIDWNGDGQFGLSGVPQDINFNGLTALLNPGANDWSYIRLNELGGRRSVGGFYKVGDRYFMGPLSLDIGRGDIGRGDIGRGDIGRGDIGRGDIGRGDIGRGDIGRGDIGRGDIGRGDIGRGDIGRGDIGRGDFGGGDMDVGAADEILNGELDYETFTASTGNAPTPPNSLTACLTTQGGICAPSGGSRPVRLDWQPPNVGTAVGYSVYRFEYDPDAIFPPGSFNAVLVGTTTGTSFIDPAGTGTNFAYYVTATLANGQVSGISNFATIAVPGPIDFEQFTNAPSTFQTIQPPVTVGLATFSGGHLLNATTFLPVNPSVVYGTAYFCGGCLPTMTIDFARSVSNLSFFLMNGRSVTVTYTVDDGLGGTQTFTLAPNSQNGATTVSVPGPGIRSVTIVGDDPLWDFFVDFVQFTPGS